MKAAIAVTARQSLAREYQDAMREYLKKADESSLELAYGLGRRALEQGLGVVEIAALYDEALGRLLQNAASPAESARAARSLGHFFIESLSPFEMTHRGFRDAQAALHRLNDTLEAEARRIAHALHDEAGQLLVTVHFALEKLAQGLPPGFESQVQDVRGRLGEVEQELRRLSHELRPPMLDDLGLIPALDFLAQGVAKRAGIRITVDGWIPARLPPLSEIAVYRGVQEALSNATKHAHASNVIVSLLSRQRNGKAFAVCSVKDDGVGFRPQVAKAAADKGLGILGITERVHALGGSLDINSAPGRGTELVISLPCSDAQLPM